MLYRTLYCEVSLGVRGNTAVTPCDRAFFFAAPRDVSQAFVTLPAQHQFPLVGGSAARDPDSNIAQWQAGIDRIELSNSKYSRM